MPSLNLNLRLTEFVTAIKIRLGLPVYDCNGPPTVQMLQWYNGFTEQYGAQKKSRSILALSSWVMGGRGALTIFTVTRSSSLYESMREEERSSQEDPEVSWGLPRVSEAPTSSLVMVSRVEGRDWLLPLTGVKDRRFSLEGDEEKAGGRSREVSAIPFLLLIWVGVEGASSSWEPRGWRCRGRWRRSRGAE